MRFHETQLIGVWEVELDLLGDERGWFARTFDQQEFRARGMNPNVAQCNASFNAKRGTLRGMHYQAEPHGEAKVVRCVRGEIFDVAVDQRPESATYLGWHGCTLTAENRRALYIPVGMAHGFQTLCDGCEVLYQIGSAYVPDAARGVRWADPALAPRWPRAPAGGRLVSARDRSYPSLLEA